jgi:HAE1 family hydrophobic/amphiphilic exporter-1
MLANRQQALLLFSHTASRYPIPLFCTYIGQYTVRNQLANVPGASVPVPFGGKYRQIQVYVDPVKLEAHQLSLMDVVRTVNDSNAILPSGDVRIGPKDYNIYTNSQLPDMKDIDRLPLKTVGNGQLLISDIGVTKDASAIQTNIVRVDGQHSVYLPILKQGGDSNTIVNGIRNGIKNLVDIPKTLVARVVFDQSAFVKTAIHNLGNEGGIGLILTAFMILIFLGNFRVTLAVIVELSQAELAQTEAEIDYASARYAYQGSLAAIRYQTGQ